MLSVESLSGTNFKGLFIIEKVRTKANEIKEQARKIAWCEWALRRHLFYSQVTVHINEIPSRCDGDCSFQYMDGDTPQISGITPTEGNDTNGLFTLHDTMSGLRPMQCGYTIISTCSVLGDARGKSGTLQPFPFG